MYGFRAAILNGKEGHCSHCQRDDQERNRRGPGPTGTRGFRVARVRFGRELEIPGAAAGGSPKSNVLSVSGGATTGAAGAGGPEAGKLASR